MKKLATFFLLFMGVFAVKASHLAGASIHYDPISPTQYRVTLIIYRACEPNSITLGNSDIVTITNTCGYSYNLTVNKIANSGQGLPDECAINLGNTQCNGGTRYGFEKHEYTGIWTTPANAAQNCKQYTMSWSSGARNSMIYNITSPGSQSIYVDAYLNDTLQPKNFNARIKTLYLPGYCAGQPLCIDLGAKDPNAGDSLSYTLVRPRSAANTNIGFANGLRFDSMVPCVAGSRLTIDPISGQLCLTPQVAAQRIVVVAFRIDDWRQNALGNWVRAGWFNLDIQFVFDLNPTYCENIQPKFTQKVANVRCDQDTLQLHFTTEITCNTVSTDGSEFRLIAPYGQQVPVTATQPILCNTNSTPGIFKTKDILLTTQHGFYRNGVYKLYTKSGKDGDTFGNKCKKFMAEFDTVRVVVTGCYEYSEPVDITNVTVDPATNNAAIVEWANPAGNFDPSYFKHFQILKKRDPAANWDPIATEPNVAARSFRDSTLNVTADTAYYSVQVVLKSGIATPVADSIYNILLKYPSTNSIDALTGDVQWSNYIGWNAPSYNAEWSAAATTPTFQFFNPNISTVNNQTNFVKPLEAGNYFVRVYTDELGGNVKRAYSNWVPFEVPARDVKAYNVITPNGDGANDYFELDGLKFWPNTKVTIYNRWGQIVYKTDNYDNKWGPNAEEGSYYYIVELTTGKQKTGMLKVIK